jgi:D-arabinose 1-dehydrogenase-like Zn-dependent alcohol dehydrogenase
MRAMAVTRYGHPLERIEVPEPSLRSEHALLEVLTCGVCYSDVKTVRGKMPYSGDLALPHVPGHEVCARVIATDPPGALDEGAVVVVYHLWPCRVCARCRAGQDNICTNPREWMGFKGPGGFQDRLVVPLNRLTQVPRGIDPIHAASTTCALGTGYRAVVTRGGVRPGMRLAVLGLGGVGIHALQVGRAAGAQVVGLDVSERALKAGRGLGLDVRDNRDGDGMARILSDTDEEGVDVVVDTVGRPETIAQAERLVRAGGRIVAVGYAMGSDFALGSTRFVLEEVELWGSRYVLMNELQQAIRLVAEGKIEMVVDRVRTLEDANELVEALEAGDIVGRGVVDVAGVT